MVDSNSKGNRRERELVNELDDRGFAVMRAPASGAATERELPDVLAGLDGQFFAFEAKSSSGDPIYLTADEVDGLTYFSGNFGAEATVAARFDYNDWAFFDPDVLHTTDAGSVRVKEEDLPDGRTFEDLTPTDS